METKYFLIVSSVFVCLSASFAGALTKKECLPPVTSEELQFLCQGKQHRTGVIVSKKWNREEVKFDGKFAFIGKGDKKHKVRVIQCIPKGGLFEGHVAGQEFFTYRPNGFHEDFICKYVELEK